MTDNLFSLSGKVAIITGAAGILGSAFSRAMAEFGADVAMVDLAAPAELAAAISKDTGRRVRGYACDLAAPSAFPALVDRIESELGPVSILHNNAASKSRDVGRFYDDDDSFQLSTWREVMAVNLDAMYFMARTVGPRMAARGGGSIIQTSSIYGLVGPDPRIYEGASYEGHQIRSPAVYSASKAGIVGLTRHLAALWGAQGVRVNCLAPGGVDSGQNDAFRINYSRRVPMARMAKVDDLIGAVIYLASDASGYVTGQVLAVDGGLTAW